MPKVKFLVGEKLVSADGSKTYFDKGSVYELPEKSVVRWIMRGKAERVRDNANAIKPKTSNSFGDITYDPEVAEKEEKENKRRETDFETRRVEAEARKEAKAKARAEEKAEEEAAEAKAKADADAKAAAEAKAAEEAAAEVVPEVVPEVPPEISPVTHEVPTPNNPIFNDESLREIRRRARIKAE